MAGRQTAFELMGALAPGDPGGGAPDVVLAFVSSVHAPERVLEGLWSRLPKATRLLGCSSFAEIGAEDALSGSVTAMGFQFQGVEWEIFKLDEAMYTIRFNELLERLDPDNIFNAIGDISNGRDAALLCFEKPGEFCHRRLVAKWLENGLGFEVNEWRSTAKDEDRRPPEAPQLSLF